MNINKKATAHKLTDENGKPLGILDRLHEASSDIPTDYYNIASADIALNNIRDGIIAIDKDGRIFYANEAYHNILGVSVERIIGRRIQDVEPSSALAAQLEDPHTVHKAKQHIRSINKYVSIHIVPVFEEGKFLGAFSIFTDKTSSVLRQQELSTALALNDELESKLNAFRGADNASIVCKSDVFRNVLDQALLVAKTDAPVLIRGESGTGKEVVARFIHEYSKRSKKLPVTVNCAAIPPSLIESELFGYEEGSFTGARKGGSKGKFELANGSTIFLDEIGEMPMMMQSKLLRVLQEGEIEKIGRQQAIPVDVRVIAATNQPLEEMIERKEFRKDLYYRLNIVEITIPPLRERRDDIIPLAERFLEACAVKYDKRIYLSREVSDLFLSYSWPGNVREMQNCIEHAVIMCRSDELGLSDIPLPIRGIQTSAEASMGGHSESNTDTDNNEDSVTFKGTLKEAVRECEIRMLRQAILRNEGNRTKAMSELGISRRTFYRKLAEYGIYE